MEIKEVKRIGHIDKAEFKDKYLKYREPVVITGLTEDWGARKKWNFDYMAEKVGDVIVPLYDSTPTRGRESTQKPATKMTMRAYMEILKKGPSDLRLFFFNLLQKCPELLPDFEYPDVGLKFFKKLPTLFFGGAGSRVLMHYDMDLSHNMHFNFQGIKDIILFAPNQTKFLYKQPFSIVSMHDVQIDKPDYEKFPALKFAKGQHAVLEHGEALFIPSGYWHFIRYVTPSLSITLRAYPRSAKSMLKTFRNVFLTRSLDHIVHSLLGQKWLDWKNKEAIKRTERNIPTDKR